MVEEADMTEETDMVEETGTAEEMDMAVVMGMAGAVETTGIRIVVVATIGITTVMANRPVDLGTRRPDREPIRMGMPPALPRLSLEGVERDILLVHLRLHNRQHRLHPDPTSREMRLSRPTMNWPSSKAGT